MFVMLDIEDLAGMSIEELEEHIQELCIEKVEQAARVKLLDSPLGQEEIKRWEQRVEETRSAYGRIKIAEASDRDIVMAFVEQRCKERLALDELAALNSAKKVYESLDEYHGKCNSTLSLKKKQARVARK